MSTSTVADQLRDPKLRARVLERIAHLLALSTSSNVHEAALAAAKAQSLMFRYNLHLEQIKAGSHKSTFIKHVFDMGVKGNETWRQQLLIAICTYNWCKPVFNKFTAGIIGEDHNITICTYLYEYLLRAIIRLGNTDWEDPGDLLAARLTGRRVYLNNFYYGAVDIIQERLKQQRAEQQTASAVSNALVLVKDEELRKAVVQFYPKMQKKTTTNKVSIAGYEAGKEAGKTIPINPVIESGRTKS